jgi:hypothetical protein
MGLPQENPLVQEPPLQLHNYTDVSGRLSRNFADTIGPSVRQWTKPKWVPTWNPNLGMTHVCVRNVGNW